MLAIKEGHTVFNFFPGPLVALESVRETASTELGNITDAIVMRPLKNARETVQNLVAGAIALLIQGLASSPETHSPNILQNETARRTIAFYSGFERLGETLYAPSTSTIQ